MDNNAVYRFRVMQNYPAIIRDLEAKKLLPDLFSAGVLKDYDDMDEVKSEKTRKQQAEKLLEMLDRRGNAYVYFVEALKKSPQCHLANLLNKPVDGEQNFIQQMNTVNPISQAFNRLDIHTSSGYNAVNIGDPYVQVTNRVSFEPPPSSYRTVRTPVPEENAEGLQAFVIPTNCNLLPPQISPDSPDVYRMMSSPRGVALIINNNKFDEGTPKKLDKRLGSEADVGNLEKLFGPQGLNFEMNIQENLTAEEIDKCLEQTAKLQEHCDYDCFVLFLMSHGDNGFVYGKDGKKFLISKIGNYFSSCHSVPLMKKPKLFFIQACRGESSEIGMIVKDSPDVKEKTVGSMSDIHFDFGEYRTHPDFVDMLFAFASVEGYAAHRNKEQGSWFISDIVDVFREKAGCTDVLKMLTMVNRKVAERGEIGKKQVPQPKSTLTKDVYFWPGLFKGEN